MPRIESIRFNVSDSSRDFFTFFTFSTALLSIVLFRFKELYRNIRQLVRPNPTA